MEIDVLVDGGCRERIRDSARRLRVLREVFGGVPELILESPEVPLEPLGVILGHPGSIRSSGFWFLVSGALRDPKLSTKLLVAATEIILSTWKRF